MTFRTYDDRTDSIIEFETWDEVAAFHGEQIARHKANPTKASRLSRLLKWFGF